MPLPARPASSRLPTAIVASHSSRIATAAASRSRSSPRQPAISDCGRSNSSFGSWAIRAIDTAQVLATSIARASLIPPAVDPAPPPTTMARTIGISAAAGQPEISALLKPAVLSADTAWNAAWARVSAAAPPVPASRISTASATTP